MKPKLCQSSEQFSVQQEMLGYLRILLICIKKSDIQNGHKNPYIKNS